MEEVGRGMWRMLPALSGFLLASEQLNSRDITSLSKSIRAWSHIKLWFFNDFLKKD